MARLRRVAEKSTRTIIGLMSGMSMDGVDLALARVGDSIELLDSFHQPYDADFVARLQKGRTADAREVCQLNVLVAERFADAVNAFIRSRGIERASIDAIGSHGQTLVHIPPGDDSATASTLQVGDGAVIAELTGLPTVFNFRPRDMAVGGQGAPLVPLVDWLLYHAPDQTIALNNLGSISNVTVVTPKLADVIAFDTGPANMPIDFFAARVPGNADRIDRDGALSAKGSIDSAMLSEMMALPFIDAAPPKSAGYDDFGPAFLEKLAPRVSPIDRLRTAVEFSAASIARNYALHVPPIDSVSFSGGGVHNATLMQRIAALLPDDIRIEPLADDFSDAKEALAFAVLANETLSGRPTTVPGATGAGKAVVSGQIAL